MSVFRAVVLASALVVAPAFPGSRAIAQAASSSTDTVATPARLAAARDLFTAMRMDKMLLAATESQFDAMVQANAQLAPYRDVFTTWANKFLVSPEMLDPIIREYAKAFTVAELNDLATFYRTPTGQKALTVLPSLMQRGAQIGSDVGQRHQAELSQMLQERKEQLERQGAGTDTTHH